MNTEKARILLLPENIAAIDKSAFEAIPLAFHTMARPKFLAVMSSLVGCMNNNERYLEVGTYQGGSLIGALLQNGKRALAVDNFCQFTDTNSLQLLKDHVNDFGMSDRIEIFNMDCYEFFRMHPDPLNIGVYYYDGGHDEQSTYSGLEAGFPHVSVGGFIVLDDTFYDCVGYGINQFMGNHRYEVRVVAAASPHFDYHTDWWNGTIFIQRIK